MQNSERGWSCVFLQTPKLWWKICTRHKWNREGMKDKPVTVHLVLGIVLKAETLDLKSVLMLHDTVLGKH